MKVTIDAKATPFTKTIHHLEKDMETYSEVITNKTTIDKSTHILRRNIQKSTLISYGI